MNEGRSYHRNHHYNLKWILITFILYLLLQVIQLHFISTFELKGIFCRLVFWEVLYLICLNTKDL